MTVSSIRRATLDDAEVLAELGLTTFVDTFAHLYPPEDLAAFLAEAYAEATFEAFLTLPGHALWLAERDGEAIGYAQAGPCALLTRRSRRPAARSSGSMCASPPRTTASAGPARRRPGLACRAGSAAVDRGLVREPRRPAPLRPPRLPQGRRILLPRRRHPGPRVHPEPAVGDGARWRPVSPRRHPFSTPSPSALCRGSLAPLALSPDVGVRGCGGRDPRHKAEGDGCGDPTPATRARLSDPPRSRRRRRAWPPRRGCAAGRRGGR